MPVRRIPLSSNLHPNLFVLVDDEDYERVSQHTWYPHFRKNNKLCHIYTKVKHRSVYLHRFILEVSNPSIFVDHIDRDILNSSRSNLRLVNNQQNSMNSGNSHKTKWACSSKFKGVRISRGGFQTTCGFKRPHTETMRFSFSKYSKDLAELHAAYSYNVLAKLLHGDYVGYFNTIPLDYIPSKDVLERLEIKSQELRLKYNINR